MPPTAHPIGKKPSSKAGFPARPGFYIYEEREPGNKKSSLRYYISDWECHRARLPSSPEQGFPNPANETTVQQSQHNQRPERSVGREGRGQKIRLDRAALPRRCAMARGEMRARRLLPRALRGLLGCRRSRIPEALLRGPELRAEVCQSGIRGQGVALEWAAEGRRGVQARRRAELRYLFRAILGHCGVGGKAICSLEYVPVGTDFGAYLVCEAIVADLL